MSTILFTALKNELIDGEDSFVDNYNTQRSNYSYESITNEIKVEVLEDQMKIFSALLEKFQKNYIEIFSLTAKQLKDQNSTQKEKDKYLKVGELYLNIIQNLYLNQINYQINKLKSDESLSKANESLCWAKVSILIAIVSFIISIILSIVSIKKTIYYGKNPTPCSCCSSEQPKTETQQTISAIDSSTIENSVIPLKLDTNTRIK